MTELRRYSNTAAATTLSAGITSGSTSLAVNAATNYPTAPFTIAVESEIVLVGGKSGLTFNTLTRGHDGTVAAAHSSGVNVTHKAIADDFDFKWVDTVTTRPHGSYDDEFMDASIDTDWTEVTPTGTATWTEANGVMSVLFDEQVASDCAGLIRTMGAWAPPIYLHTAVRVMGSREIYLVAGPLFSDGITTTSNVVWQMPFRGASDLVTASLRSGTFTNVATTLYDASIHGGGAGLLHLRLDWVNTNTWRAWYSPDGVSWTDLGQGNDSTTMTPTHFGLGVSTWEVGVTPKVATFEFMRAYETKPTEWEDGT